MSASCRWSGPRRRTVSTARRSRPAPKGFYEVHVSRRRRAASCSARMPRTCRWPPSDSEFYDSTMRASLLRAGGRGDRRPLLHGRHGGRARRTTSSTWAAGVTVVEERDLWDMPFLLLLLAGLDARRVGLPAVQRAGMRGAAVLVALAGWRLGAVAAPASAQQTHLLVIDGPGRRGRLHGAVSRLGHHAASTQPPRTRYAVPAGNITYLGEKPELAPEKIADRSSTRERHGGDRSHRRRAPSRGITSSSCSSATAASPIRPGSTCRAAICRRTISRELLERLDGRARDVRQHRERQRAVRREAVGREPRGHDGHPLRRRAQRRGVRRVLRRGVRRRGGGGRPEQGRAGLDARSVRRTPASAWSRATRPTAASRPSTRCSTTTATAPAADEPDPLGRRRRTVARTLFFTSGADLAGRCRVSGRSRAGCRSTRNGLALEARVDELRRIRGGEPIPSSTRRSSNGCWWSWRSRAARSASGRRRRSDETTRETLARDAGRSPAAALPTAVVAGLGVLAAPQRGRRRRTSTISGNTAYDGRFVFVRIRYDMGFSGGFFRRDLPWAHDYPLAERNLSKILEASDEPRSVPGAQRRQRA